jgi:hypothetical protein
VSLPFLPGTAVRGALGLPYAAPERRHPPFEGIARRGLVRPKRGT